MKRPEPVPYAKLENPQTLNLYTYGQNNPLRRTDPDGHCTVDNEEHGFLWCLGHVLGVTETKQEEQNYADNQRNRIAEKHLALENGQSLDQKYLATLSNADVNTLAHQLAGQQMDQAFAALSIMDLFGGGGKDITRPGSRYQNTDTGMSQTEFGKKLESEGFTKSTTSDGSAQFSKDGAAGKTEVTMYPKRTSTGDPGGQVKVDGKVTEKLSFKP